MNNINTVQNYINKKAEQRLDEDIQKVVNFFKGAQLGNNILLDVMDKAGIEIIISFNDEVEITGKPRNLFWTNKSEGFVAMRNAVLNEYIETETNRFVAEIADIKERINYLMDENDNNI